MQFDQSNIVVITTFSKVQPWTVSATDQGEAERTLASHRVANKVLKQLKHIQVGLMNIGQYCSSRVETLHITSKPNINAQVHNETQIPVFRQEQLKQVNTQWMTPMYLCKPLVGLSRTKSLV